MSIQVSPRSSNLDRPSRRQVAGCVPGTQEAARVSELFKLVSDPTRLTIVTILSEREESVSGILGEFPGVEDQLISRHLGILRRGGLVESRTSGAFRIYELTELGRLVARVTDRARGV